ncbi:hypothetical protein LF63_0106775 [Oleiagrimonas soli]|uniref:Uncharacterized protein n=1 Tax=Oleiagrimonas soli TaxID=1543381 RepID=A0A099CWR6_9GAMM|nr:hypothetical protein LF63_0106775 [Oleiagrimonas soli]
MSGTADLNGEGLTVDVNSGTYTVGTQYTIVKAGSLTGTFGSVAYNPLFASYITLQITYSGTDAQLTLTPTPGSGSGSGSGTDPGTGSGTGSGTGGSSGGSSGSPSGGSTGGGDLGPAFTTGQGVAISERQLQ